jgi:hypothetical protein
MNIARFFTFILFATFSWVIGCETTTRDPLAGWKPIYSDQLNKIVADDYQNYIQKLSSKEKYYIQGYNIHFFENEAGAQAVRISIPLNGVWREHVLIYDKDNKRIKVIKYAGGEYRS